VGCGQPNQPAFRGSFARAGATESETVWLGSVRLRYSSCGLRLATRRDTVAPFVAELETWMHTERGKLSRHAEVSKAMKGMLR
jgi:hypothetical protein